MPDEMDLVALSAALEAARRALQGGGSFPVAKKLAQNLLRRGPTPFAVEDVVALTALCRIAGQPYVHFDLSDNDDSPESRARSKIAGAWIRWIDHQDPTSVEEVRRALDLVDQEVVLTSVIDGMTLKLWGEACLQLMQGNASGARKAFDRALEYGGSFGSDTFPSVEWSYVGSFWPKLQGL